MFDNDFLPMNEVNKIMLSSEKIAAIFDAFHQNTTARIKNGEAEIDMKSGVG